MGGRSRCPHCGRQLGVSENIPLFGWIALRGRCKGCGERVSARYPFTEAITGALFALAAWKFGITLEGVVYAGFFWMLVVLSVIDLEFRKLPTRIVLPGGVAGALGLVAVALFQTQPSDLFGAFLGAVVFAGFFFLLELLGLLMGKTLMGGGDTNLSVILGVFLGFLGGPAQTVVGMFLGFLAGGVISVVLVLFKGATRESQVPFGPFLAIGAVAGVLWGQAILDAYLGSF
jgi:leader peptidase (prepilin peptidase)/N-methyltransferase